MSNPGAARTPTTRDIIFQKVLLSHGRKRSHKESWTKRTQAKRKKPAVKGRKKEQCQQQQVHAENPLELPVSIVVEQSVKEVRQNVEKEVVELFKSQVTRSQGRQEESEKAGNPSRTASMDDTNMGARDHDDDGYVAISLFGFRHEEEESAPRAFANILELLKYRVCNSLDDAAATAELLFTALQSTTKAKERLSILRCIDCIVCDACDGYGSYFCRYTDSQIQWIVKHCVEATLNAKFDEDLPMSMSNEAATILEKWARLDNIAMPNLKLAVALLYRKRILKPEAESSSKRKEKEREESYKEARKKLLLCLKDKDDLFSSFKEKIREFANLVQAFLPQRAFEALIDAFPVIKGVQNDIWEKQQQIKQDQHQNHKETTLEVDSRYMVDDMSEEEEEAYSSSDNKPDREKSSQQKQNSEEWSSGEDSDTDKEGSDVGDIHDLFVNASGEFDYDEYRRWEDELSQSNGEECAAEEKKVVLTPWQQLEQSLPIVVSVDLQDTWFELQNLLKAVKHNTKELQQRREQLEGIMEILQNSKSKDWRLDQARHFDSELVSYEGIGCDVITIGDLLGISTPRQRRKMGADKKVTDKKETSDHADSLA